MARPFRFFVFFLPSFFRFCFASLERSIIVQPEFLDFKRLRVSFCKDENKQKTRNGALKDAFPQLYCRVAKCLFQQFYALPPLHHTFPYGLRFAMRTTSTFHVISPVILPADPSRKPGRDSRAVSLEYLVGPGEVEEVVHLLLAPRQVQAQPLLGLRSRGRSGGSGRVFAAGTPLSPHADERSRAHLQCRAEGA